jgi:hypothetical protein
MVEEREAKTGLVCVMLEQVEEDSDSDSDADSDLDEDEDFADDEDADFDAAEDDGSDDEDDSSDEEWRVDDFGLKGKLAHALKVFVPPAAAEALETAQLTMTMAEAVPGVGVKIAEKLVAGAESADEASDAQFADAFAATVAMGEVDARATWAADKREAQKLLSRLGAVWARVLAAAPDDAKKPGKKDVGFARLEPDSRADMREHLQRLREKWGDEEDENGDALGLAFDHTEGAKAKTKTATAGKKRPRK